MLTAAYGKDITLAVEGGKLASDTGAKTYVLDEVKDEVVAKTGTSVGEEYYAVSLAGKVGKLGLEAAYIDYKEDSTLKEDNNIWALAANYRFDQDPRNVAKHAEEYLKSTGIADEMRIGPEFEFHVFDHVSYSTKPNESGFVIDTEQAEWNTE